MLRSFTEYFSPGILKILDQDIIYYLCKVNFKLKSKDRLRRKCFSFVTIKNKILTTVKSVHFLVGNSCFTDLGLSNLLTQSCLHWTNRIVEILTHSLDIVKTNIDSWR